jgi:hypothetical protein
MERCSQTCRRCAESCCHAIWKMERVMLSTKAGEEHTH